MPPIYQFDTLLHQPIRTQLVAYLAGRESASFSELKRQLDITDGNLDAHLRKLIESGYVTAEKDHRSTRVTTLYFLSTLGREALKHYINELHALVIQANQSTRKTGKTTQPETRRPKPTTLKLKEQS